MGNQTGVAECTKMCEGMLDVPQRQRYASQVEESNQKLIKTSKPSKKYSLQPNHRTQIYKSQLIIENEFQSRQSSVYDLVSNFINEQYRDQLPTIQFQSGAEYTGQWVQDKMDGKGKLICVDGSVVQGQFSQGKVHGRAKIQFADGDSYDGQWESNKAHGFGVYNHNSGAIYEGYWSKNLQNGIGIQIWTDNSKYEGSYINGKKHGNGKYTWPDDSYYKGEWNHNKIQGYGEYIWSNGRSYKGNWKDNQMHGYGVHIWEDGRKYQGNYVMDKKDGAGKYFWPDGKRFQGNWINGKRQGVGKLISESGQCRLGLWQNDKKVKWLTQDQAQQIINSTNTRSRKQSKTSQQRKAKNGFDHFSLQNGGEQQKSKIRSQSPFRNFQSIKSQNDEAQQRQSIKKNRKIF